jgi:hypothetical protein
MKPAPRTGFLVFAERHLNHARMGSVVGHPTQMPNRGERRCISALPARFDLVTYEQVATHAQAGQTAMRQLPGV